MHDLLRHGEAIIPDLVLLQLLLDLPPPLHPQVVPLADIERRRLLFLLGLVDRQLAVPWLPVRTVYLLQGADLHLFLWAAPRSTQRLLPHPALLRRALRQATRPP